MNTNVFASPDDDKQEFIQKVMMSETVTLAVKKETTDNLMDTLASLDSDLTLNKLDQLFNGYNTYLAKDTNSLFISPDVGVLGFPNYVKAEIGSFEGLTNTKSTLNTNLSEDALGLKGSNSHEVHMKASVMNLMLEIMSGDVDGLPDEDADDGVSNIAKLLKSKNIFTSFFTKHSNLNKSDDPSDEDKADEFFESLTEADDYYVSLGKRTQDELKLEVNKISNDKNYTELKDSDDYDGDEPGIQARAFLANDGNTAYIFLTHKNSDYLSHLKIQKQGDEEHKTVDVLYTTNLPHETLNFVGSSSNEVNITVDVQFVMNEIFGFGLADQQLIDKVMAILSK